jgi:transcriptional regulator with XRE-family HTH domain
LLIWSLDAVTLCTKHGERLSDKCPHCKHQLPFLATDYRPGYCSRCKQWLGNSNTEKANRLKNEITQAELSQQFQIQHSIGELLSNSRMIEFPPSHQTFVANLIKLIGKYANNSINLFSDIVGIWSGTIRRLLASESKLRLVNLCQICSRLNITPLDLLAEQGNEEYLRRHHIVLEDIPSLKAITSWSEIEGKLKAALQEYPPPSMESTARNLGYYTPKIRRHFPELCEQLISRYKEYQKNSHPSPEEIRRAFRAALKEFPPPSLQMVLRSLGCKSTGAYYYCHYLDLCLEVSKRFKDHRTNCFNKGKDYKRLEAALVEEPPPSFSEVARRFRRKREFFTTKIPGTLEGNHRSIQALSKCSS